MNKYSLMERGLPLDASWDVIVVGGGPAGCTAAASAAREGARVLLNEATVALGGMGTSGLVQAWCPFTDKEKIIYGGLQAATHCFVLANVDEYGYRCGVKLHGGNPDSPIGAILKEGKHPDSEASL